MKRTLSIFLAVLLFFGLLPVGARAVGTEPAALSFEETQTLDFVEFTLTKAELYDKIVYGSWYTQAAKGKQYLSVSGPAKNVSNSYLELGQLLGEVVIDDTYTFSMSRFFVEGDGYKNIMEPLSEGTLYLYAEIPDELAGSFTSASFRFGFNENFEEKPEKLADAKYAYRADVSKGEDSPVAIDLHEFSPVKYKLKDELTADSLKLTFNKKVAKKKVSLDVGTSYPWNYEAASGRKYIGLIGTVSNTGKDTIQPRISGYIEIGEYKYTLDYTLYDYRLGPKCTSAIFIHAEVPDSVLKKADSAKIYFGFNDGFTNYYDAVPEACQYSYVYTLKFE